MTTAVKGVRPNNLMGLLIVGAALLTGCPSPVVLLPSGCVPGAQATCGCPGGASSVQVCAADRTFGPCQCGSDGGLDSAASDAGDAGTTTPETGTVDVGAVDVSTVETGALDTGVADTNTEDLGSPVDGGSAMDRDAGPSPDVGQSTDLPATSDLATPVPVNAAAVIRAMGTGFNLGNTFDLQQHSTDPAQIRPIIDLYFNAGMRHVRLPVTWMEGFGGNPIADAAGNINLRHPRFLQMVSVLDYALSRGMYVIINTHHEFWLKDTYDGAAIYNTRFTNLWTNIARFFEGRPSQLIFEVLNEPERAFGDWSGGANPFDASAQALTRQVNQVGYAAIRATGGNNSTRIVLVMPNGQGNQSLIDEIYPNRPSLPGGGSDPYVAISVHTYDPWGFCGQDGNNAAWPGSAFIRSAVDTVAAHSRTLGVAVHYGEFGVGRLTDTGERNTPVVREYYRAMRTEVLSRGMSPTVWDDRGWFATTNASGTRFLYDIIPSMMAP